MSEHTGTRPIDIVRALGNLVAAYQQWSTAQLPVDGLSPARTRITLTEEGDRRSRSDWAHYESRCVAPFDGVTPETRARLVQTLSDLHTLLTAERAKE